MPTSENLNIIKRMRSARKLRERDPILYNTSGVKALRKNLGKDVASKVGHKSKALHKAKGKKKFDGSGMVSVQGSKPMKMYLS